ncbi:MAG: aldolase/citrate lyase family protein, partial [Bacteroidia bacterium]|nr:aldolase/citrate lyase family protein [Bacteroidia bacterium]
DKAWLLPRNPRAIQPTTMDRRRFSRLYLPGNSPSLMINAFLHQPDGLILDLEDSVAPEKKPEARVLVRNALHALDFGNAERMVRINQLPAGLEDLNWLIPQGVNLVLLPKCESADQVLTVTDRIEEIKRREAIVGDIWIMPIIESAKGIVKAYELTKLLPDHKTLWLWQLVWKIILLIWVSGEQGRVQNPYMPAQHW